MPGTIINPGHRHAENSNLERTTMAVSRREFLHRVGRAGGYSAAFLVMHSMGLMEARAANGEDPRMALNRQILISVHLFFIGNQSFTSWTCFTGL